MSFIHHNNGAVKLSAAGYLRRVRLTTSLLLQRDLRGGAEVGDEVADFVVFEGFEQALSQLLK